MRGLFALVLVTLTAWTARGFSGFKKLLPNGNRIPNVKAAGHVNAARGGGPINQFGRNFKAAGKAWTIEFCQMDSDGDGATNGEELGDPCCVWAQASEPARAAVSNPGEANKFSDVDLMQLKCPDATAVPQDVCACTDGDCKDGFCMGCNRVDADDGNYCFLDVDSDECNYWQAPYVWCGDA
ncbi:unnamed protein product [Aphanomyces euteiches]